MTVRRTDPKAIEVDADPVDAAWVQVFAAGSRVVVESWGQRVGHVRDLDGVPVEIGTPLDDHCDPPAPGGRR